MGMDASAIRNPFEDGAAMLAPLKTVTSSADIVFLISLGKSMAPFIQRFAADCKHINDLITQAAKAAGLASASIRIRVILFGDQFMYAEPFICSDMYQMPQEMERLCEFFRSRPPCYTYCPRTSGLEALLIGIHSAWQQDEDVHHRLVVISDKPAFSPSDPLNRFSARYQLELSKCMQTESSAAPRGLQDYRRIWRDGAGRLSCCNSRLMLYTGQGYPWPSVSGWVRVAPNSNMHVPLSHIGLGDILQDVFRTF